MTYAQAVKAITKPYLSRRKSNVVLSSHVGMVIAAALVGAILGYIAHDGITLQRACNYDAPHCPTQPKAPR